MTSYGNVLVASWYPETGATTTFAKSSTVRRNPSCSSLRLVSNTENLSLSHQRRLVNTSDLRPAPKPCATNKVGRVALPSTRSYDTTPQGRLRYQLRDPATATPDPR